MVSKNEKRKNEKNDTTKNGIGAVPGPCGNTEYHDSSFPAQTMRPSFFLNSLYSLIFFISFVSSSAVLYAGCFCLLWAVLVLFFVLLFK